MRAGFLLPKSAKVLGKINATLAGRRDAVKDTVRVGVQSNVQVALFCLVVQCVEGDPDNLAGNKRGCNTHAQVTSTSCGMPPVTDATARVSQVFCYACPRLRRVQALEKRLQYV